MAFSFKQVHVEDTHCGMKISTDGVLLGAWTRTPPPSAHILDVGAGSGLIALMLAQRCPSAHITALELDLNAVTDLSSNIQSSPWADRIEAVQGDFQTFTPQEDILYDLIVSNPPFFDTGIVSPDTSRAGARHRAGLDYRSLIANAHNLLSADGSLAMIVPAECESDLVLHAELARLNVSRLCHVITRPGKSAKRLLVQLDRHPGHCSDSRLTIRDVHDQWTPEYIALTKDFYLNF